MDKEEQRLYQKGYAAGRRRARVEANRELASAYQEEFVQRMMLSIAPQVISAPWGKTVDGEWIPHKGAREIMGCVRRIAEEAAQLCDFHSTARIAVKAIEAADHAACNPGTIRIEDLDGNVLWPGECA